ncbi:MAG TPA: SRPBCC domain-containing protein [Trebonia sp.]
MTGFRIVRDYPHPQAKVWRAVTDPALIPLWTVTGAGARTEGFATTVGTKFQFIAKPRPGWSGVVDCEVREADAPSLLRYSWADAAGGEVTEVTCRLESRAAGTRLTFEHSGFTGVGGFFLARILGHVRAKMLTVGLPAVLDDLTDDGTLRATSTVAPRPLA